MRLVRMIEHSRTPMLSSTRIMTDAAFEAMKVVYFYVCGSRGWCRSFFMTPSIGLCTAPVNLLIQKIYARCSRTKGSS